MYDLSIESEEYLWFITTRTLNQKLWFINNSKLEYCILAFLAKYSTLYKVELYAFCLMGNHYHLLARFPNKNRASFLRAFNSIIAKLVATHQKSYPGGKLWGRRAKVQAVPLTQCAVNTLLYSALNPTSTRLTENPKDYPGYNSFFDAINRNIKTFKILNKTAFYRRRQFDSKARKEDFIETYSLRFTTLPSYENASDEEYKQDLLKRYKERRIQIINDYKAQGRSFPNLKNILNIKTGARPFNSKISTRSSKRPLILTSCYQTKSNYLSWYFSILGQFRLAAEKLRKGLSDFFFPAGTYRPIHLNPI
ncbi:MAG: transposase [Proteobacteria bacterium]|nr:transposase [Pseudomonadota bacterium]